MIDIISIGDSTEDVFVKVSEKNANVLCEALHKNCMLCFSYADKIPAQSVHKLIGGNASNIALGSSKLGLKSAFYCVVGDDVQGRKIYNELKENKVDMKYFNLDKKTETNYSVIINLGAERTILVYHVKRKYKLPKFEKSKWVYLTSMGEGFQSILKDLEKYLVENKVKLAFNPGTHQIKYGAKKMKKILSLTDVLFLNKEEVQRFVNNNSDDVKVLLKEMRKLGPKVCVLTDGPQGAFVYDGDVFLKCGIFKVPVIERTGCGDAFATGFVSALFYGKDLGDALKWGMAESAAVLQKVGPHAGLLDFKTLDKFLSKFKKMRPYVF